MEKSRSVMSSIAKSILIGCISLGLVFGIPLASHTVTSIALAAGTNYFVDGVNGSDLNPGTSEDQAWRTIQHAADTVIGGDTVYIRAGMYNERVSLEYKGNSSGPYITFSAYPGEQVTLDGTGIAIPHEFGLFHVYGSNYIRVSGLRVQNSTATGIFVAYSDHIIVEGNSTYNTVNSGVGIWGSSSVVVNGNDIELACNPGAEENLTIAFSYDVQVNNNHVHDGPKGLDPGRAGGEGINVKDGSHNVTVYNNVCHDLENKLCFGLDGWFNETYDVEFFNNIGYNSGVGFLIESEGTGFAHDIKIYNNIAYGNTNAGFYVPNWMGDGPKANFYFINNTAYGNWRGFVVNSLNITNIVFRNNIASHNTTTQMQILAGAEQQCVVDHNLFYGPGNPIGTDFVIGNPLFVNPDGADFHLQSDSLAIDAGAPSSAPISDFDWKARPIGAGYDIGVYEFGADSLIPIYLPFVSQHTTLP